MTEKTVTSRGNEPCPVLSCYAQQYSTATLETGEFRHGHNSTPEQYFLMNVIKQKEGCDEDRS